MMELAEQAHALGANGILFDQLGVLGPKMCFNSSHGHDTPAADGHIPLLHKIAHRMRKLDPDFIVMTEGVVDAEQADVPYFHGCGPGLRLHGTQPNRNPLPRTVPLHLPPLRRHPTRPQPIPHPKLRQLRLCLRTPLRDRKPLHRRRQIPDHRSDPNPCRVFRLQLTTRRRPPPNRPLQRVRPNTCNRSPPSATSTPTSSSAADSSTPKESPSTAPDIVAKAFHSDNHIGVILWNPTDQPHSAKVIVPNHTLSAVYTPETPRPSIQPNQSHPSRSAYLCGRDSCRNTAEAQSSWRWTVMFQNHQSLAASLGPTAFPSESRLWSELKTSSCCKLNGRSAALW